MHNSPHQAPTAALFLENTHNLAGGTVLPLELKNALLETAKTAGLSTHLDGARLWNASVATGAPPGELARGFDTAMVSFSKGLGAPVGSALLVPRALEAEARRYRKILGGGMRQAGVLAAAALVALRDWEAVIAEDHQKARSLADGLAALGHRVDPPPETNMVYLEVEDAPAFCQRLASLGILALPLGATRVRFVTHRDLAPEDVAEALRRLQAL